MKNTNKYISGNTQNLSKIRVVVAKPLQAHLLDQIIYSSYNSNFVLPGENNATGWCSVPYKKLGELVGYAEDTVRKLIKEFMEKGLIQKTCKLVNNQHRACLKITEKTKEILGLSSNTVNNLEDTPSEAQQVEQASSEIEQKTRFEADEKPGSYKEIKGVYKKNTVNNITCSQVSKKTGITFNLPEKVKHLFQDIGERLEENQKADIWGTVLNLQTQDNCKFIPHEITAWFAFSLINMKKQIVNAKSFRHGLNILAKITRSGNLRKPIGFHNHWDIGLEMRKVEQGKRVQLQEEKVQHALSGADYSVEDMKRRGLYLTPDGDSITVRKVKQQSKSSSKQIESLQRERTELTTQASILKGAIKTHTLSLDKPKALAAIFKNTRLAIKEITLERREEIRKEIEDMKVEISQYEQAIREVDEKLKLAKNQFEEEYVRRETYVATYEEQGVFA